MSYQIQGGRGYGREATRPTFKLHFPEGKLALDGWTYIPSDIKGYKTTIYSNEDMGVSGNVDLRVKFYEKEERVWLSIEDDRGNKFIWDSNDEAKELSVLIYLLTSDVECLLYCSSKDYFCYHFRPAKDPHGNVTFRTANPYMNSNYGVLDELLSEKYSTCLKCYPKVWED